MTGFESRFARRFSRVVANVLVTRPRPLVVLTSSPPVPSPSIFTATGSFSHKFLLSPFGSVVESKRGLKTESSKMPSGKVDFVFRSGNGGGLTVSDPLKSPVTIVGQLDHLKKLKFEDVRGKLEPRVSADLFETSLSSLVPGPTDKVSLYLNYATLLALSSKDVSRHNTPSRAHNLAKSIKDCVNYASEEYIVLVCPKEYVLPYVAAVSRAFPTFSLKTNSSNNNNAKAEENCKKTSQIIVEILVVDKEAGVTDKLKLCKEELNSCATVSRNVRQAARLVDMPCNILNVEEFTKEAANVYQKLLEAEKPVTMTVIKDRELLDKGFGGIYNVGKAAEYPPALVVLSYLPNTDERDKKNIAWVGKGIVFDTGGLCLKSRPSMCGMKRDCGGAAAILCAFDVAVREGFKDNLHAVLCLAENTVATNSMRCDDIITLYSKKTVEVNNTDAEGRLVLGDGVAYAKKDLKCDIIVDMATLTGAQGIATGKYHGAVLTNKEEFETKAVIAGKASADLVFPIPFAPELHFSEFNSTVADMKNSVADRSNAQCSCAGLFIFSHIGFDFPGTWIHFDMASPVESGERATGYGVMLLNTLFGKSFPECSMFNKLAPK